MNNWDKKIKFYREVSQEDSFLRARINSENAAREILIKKAGNISNVDLNMFFKYCNDEIVPPNIYSNKVTHKRFGQSFIGENPKNIVMRIDECNQQIPILWNSVNIKADLDRFWNRNHITGAGTGFPTMILYLKDPYKYSIWLPSLSGGLGKFTKKHFYMTRNAKNYFDYIDDINTKLRNRYELKPQEIDYILFKIDEEYK